MIPVSVIDIVLPSPESQHRVLILMDEDGRRLLPIWIGPLEATNIALHLLGKETARPLTHTFMAGLLDKASVLIESVAVSALMDNTFYTTVHVQRGEDAFAIDARPSDAIALALHTQPDFRRRRGDGRHRCRHPHRYGRRGTEKGTEGHSEGTLVGTSATPARDATKQIAAGTA